MPPGQRNQRMPQYAPGNWLPQGPQAFGGPNGRALPGQYLPPSNTYLPQDILAMQTAYMSSGMMAPQHMGYSAMEPHLLIQSQMHARHPSRTNHAEGWQQSRPTTPQPHFQC